MPSAGYCWFSGLTSGSRAQGVPSEEFGRCYLSAEKQAEGRVGGELHGAGKGSLRGLGRPWIMSTEAWSPVPKEPAPESPEAWAACCLLLGLTVHALAFSKFY